MEAMRQLVRFAAVGPSAAGFYVTNRYIGTKNNDDKT